MKTCSCVILKQSKTQFPEAPCPNPTHMTMVTITTMIAATPTVTSANERKVLLSFS